MKFNHWVKHNGISYPAGTDVPIENTKGGDTNPAPLSSGKEDAVKKYNEADLPKKYFELKSLAMKEGCKVDKKTTAAELKEMLLRL